MRGDGYPKGERHYRTTLTEDDVRLIRALGQERHDLRRQAAELSNAVLADKFGISERSVSDIIAGVRWSHV